MQANSFKGELYSLLSDIDAEETFPLPSELGDLLNLYIQTKTNEKNRSLFEYKMEQVQSSLSDRYRSYVPIEYSEEDVISYALYYFPLNFPKIQYILYDLIRYGNPEVLKKSQIKILDVGTGCGTIPISLSFFLKSIGDFEQLKIDVIEPNEFFITEFHKLKDIVNSEKYGVSIICDNFKSGSFNDADVFNEINEEYDFITFSNVINESGLSIEELAKWMKKYTTKLNENGHLILIEPEDKIRAGEAVELRNVLLNMDVDICCPGENLWEITNKNCDNWCVIRKSIEIPDNQGFSLISTYKKGINFFYLISNKNGHVLAPNTNYTKLNDLKIGTRVNICGKVIERNEYERVTHLFLCDGTQKVKIFAYKYKYGGTIPHPSYGKCENLKINDIVLFKKVYIKEDTGGGIQIEIDYTTGFPKIIDYFD